jgi:hypothetical protein
MSEQPKEETPFERFQRIAQKIVSVPKKEIDKREKAWKRKKLSK